MKKTKKKIRIYTTCGRVFQIDVHEIADNRAKYYAKKDKDTTYEEEYEFLVGDDFEVKDWLFNQMDWYECSTLIESECIKRDIKSLEIKEVLVSEGKRI
jgi:hypothetical protein